MFDNIYNIIQKFIDLSLVVTTKVSTRHCVSYNIYYLDPNTLNFISLISQKFHCKRRIRESIFRCHFREIWNYFIYSSDIKIKKEQCSSFIVFLSVCSSHICRFNRLFLLCMSFSFCARRYCRQDTR